MDSPRVEMLPPPWWVAWQSAAEADVERTEDSFLVFFPRLRWVNYNGNPANPGL